MQFLGNPLYWQVGVGKVTFNLENNLLVDLLFGRESQHLAAYLIQIGSRDT